MISGSQPSATVGDSFVRSYRDRLSPLVHCATVAKDAAPCGGSVSEAE